MFTCYYLLVHHVHHLRSVVCHARIHQFTHEDYLDWTQQNSILYLLFCVSILAAFVLRKQVYIGNLNQAHILLTKFDSCSMEKLLVKLRTSLATI